ncbi:MBL fold metallo-hydrolase [Tuwongella immobilis]|uniref:Metallo-beta-lactamase domain-containing protein n=1 Tax=Tuwongella immobilis TaxID=692036 RepID=A0A6C2YR08_9BACT|nr:MBL fold metallo-hydrolase [Tuwongella immobilis]VIP03589.1 Uncharacterized protein OS=Sorangium cellulosum (strain So ce56) GN=sce4166 PE=4 SV=1: Lactamase_B: Beta-Casp: RMMBL [Tuwongella immobilis]VTS04546.1 Uncharacterized protein OS=Sorangium cellulosum (strain So ce56) GN=sce4166 PE=4 SV=1: Lactamase_B: Beta-Casp: RMMBL [Tuwongella immobilis]
MVTGSMHLVEVGSTRVLLDCGMVQGKREDSRRRNDRFPFPTDQIDAVLISHSHIDHCGNLPTLVRHGYTGPIYCTSATRDLLAVMLRDSAKIQEEDAAHLNILRQYAEPWVEPLYTQVDVDQTLDQCVPVRYHTDQVISPSMRCQFLPAGHVLGSAMLHLTLKGSKGERRLTFTGDLGRRGMPMLQPSDPIPPADVLVSESTYGNRTHEQVSRTIEKLHATIRTTYDRGGKVLIPAFSLGRIQLIIHYIDLAIRQGHIPDMPIYVDSPLAADVAGVYRDHPECLTAEMRADRESGHGLFGEGRVRYIRKFEESVEVSRRPGPYILLAASGMCDAGRIVHHLKMHVDDPRCTVVLVSYQAPGTTGRRLLEPGPKVRIAGKDWNKWIDVVHLDGFSGHADREDFLAYLTPLIGKIGKIRLIHGEREQADALSETLRNLGFPDVGVPEPGEKVVIDW